MLIDGMKYGMTEEQCKDTKKVISKYGISMVCDEEPEVKADITLPASEECENMKETVSKYGLTVVCED